MFRREVFSAHFRGPESSRKPRKKIQEISKSSVSFPVIHYKKGTNNKCNVIFYSESSFTVVENFFKRISAYINCHPRMIKKKIGEINYSAFYFPVVH